MLTFEAFLLAQPCYPEEMPTDRYYYDLAARLVKVAMEKRIPVHESLIERAALCVIGYYQDMIADAGLWHGFTDECRRLYATPVPFFIVEDDYIDYELNREDIGFLVWYSIAMYSDDRCIDPFKPALVRLADLWFDELEAVYVEAPVPEGYHLAHELEVYAEEDREMILKLGNWLYLNSWLLRPAFAFTAGSIISDMNSAGKSPEEITAALQDAIKQEPTGPLALYIGEWVNLTVHHRLPTRRQRKESKESHPAFDKLVSATGGSPVKFIEGYDAFNNFLIEVLGWEPGEEHLAQLKHCRDFVLMVNPEKGLLVAPDICRCSASPENTMYNKEYAVRHAMELLTVRGRCPHDLLSYICQKGWLPDAHFPESPDHHLVSRFHDFIARCYLQLYYRGD